MPSKDYQVVFRGRLVPGQDPDLVKQNLAKLFKVDEARIGQMFSGKRQVLKKGLDRETADKYRALLKKAGAIVAVVSEETQRSARVMPDDPPADPAPPQSADSGQDSPAQASGNRAVFAVDDPGQSAAGRAVFSVDDPGAESPASGSRAPAEEATSPQTVAPDSTDDSMLAPVGEQIIEQQPVESLDFDIDGLTMAQVGSVVDESPPPPPVDIDTSGLAATDIDDALDSSPPPPAPDIDTEGLGVADDDAVMDDSPPPPPPDIDTSGLSASDDFEALDEGPKKPPPQIDTSHLGVEEP